MVKWFLLAVVLVSAPVAGGIAALVETPEYNTYVCPQGDEGNQTKTKSQNTTYLMTWLRQVSCWGPQEWTALATVLLTFITIGLVAAGIDQSSTARSELRAYVKMSHVPPGLDTDEFKITIRVKNFGKTPARVTNLLIKSSILAATATLPEPDYSASEEEIAESKQAFLVPKDRIFVGRPFTIAPTDWAAIIAGLKTLYIYGYVDYIDAFKRRFRGGYGRVFVPGLDVGPKDKRNNLNVVADGRYNYDRPRIRGEGQDWH